MTLKILFQATTPPQNAGDPKNLLSQRKELWVFWYGDRPAESFKKLISPKLKEVDDLSGTWENGLPYEARTLLFKALNNLIERNLVSKDFVRLGKWFVQPFDGPDEGHGSSPSASGGGPRAHLSFSFDYFIHGESSVCASVDVRQHPPVRRLALHHLALARGQSAPVQVALAPYGLAGTLTGVSYRRAPGGGGGGPSADPSVAGAADPGVDRLLRDWKNFYPLSRNRYYCQNLHGELVPMPAAVEVLVAGVRAVYPTSYVLATDIDHHHHHGGGGIMGGGGEGVPKTLQTCDNPSGKILYVDVQL